MSQIDNADDITELLSQISTWEPVDDAAFVLIGDVPDYSHRLPDDWHTCVYLRQLGTHHAIYYSPRMFTIDKDAGELTLHDGTMDESLDGDVEFEVTIDCDRIIKSEFINRSRYDGPLFHEM